MIVSTKGWKTDRPSKKHNKMWEGPFPIVKKVGSTFQVLLPPQIKVHDVFYPEKLRKHPMKPTPWPVTRCPELIKVDGEDEHELGKIIACKLGRIRPRRHMDYDGNGEGRLSKRNLHFQAALNDVPLSAYQTFAPTSPFGRRSHSYCSFSKA